MRYCCFDLYDAVCVFEFDGGIAIAPPAPPPVAVAVGGLTSSPPFQDGGSPHRFGLTSLI